MHFTALVYAKSRDCAQELLAPYDDTNEDYFDFTPVISKAEAEREAFNGSLTLEEYMHMGGYVQRGQTLGFLENPNGCYDYYGNEDPVFVTEHYLRPGTALDDELSCEPKDLSIRRKWDRLPYMMVTPDGGYETPDTVGIKFYVEDYAKTRLRMQQEGFRCYFFDLHG
jgi:hypothetical protein